MTITAASVAGRAVSPTTSDQTIHLPLGGILRAGDRVQARLIYRATLRGDVSGSDWMFTRVNGVIEAYRWLPWISQPIPFARPNHGDPFVTPVSPRVRVTVIADRLIRWATAGEQLTPIGTAQTFEARNVRDFSIVGAPDFRTRREPPAA